MNKTKIAVLIDWYLPGTKAGGPIRSIYSLVNLLKNDFEFYILTTNLDLGSKDPYNDVLPDTLFNHQLINYYYFSKEGLNTVNILSLLSEIKPDLLYLNSFWSFHFSINIVRLKNKNLVNVPVLLAPRGMLGKGALGLKSYKKGIFLFLAKLFSSYKKITFHATQEEERNDILSKFKQAKVLVAPNINSSPAVENKSVKKINHLKLFYLSRIAKVKNLHYALEVLSLIPKEYSIEYTIYGNAEEKDYWEHCLELISKLPAHIKVEYKGELPFDKVQQSICTYNCLFMPTLNENFGHSIVESLLCGCPVIISDQTPWKDLEEGDAGFSINLSHKQKFSQAIIYYASMNERDFSLKSKNAISYISKKINLPQVANHYKNLFNDSIKN